MSLITKEEILMKKVSSALFVIIIIFVCLAIPTYAASIPEARFPEETTTIANVGGIILGVATTIGMIVAVVMLVFLAIKYMSSSPNDKAEIKKHIVVWVVGAVLLFAASGTVKLIQGLGGAIDSELGRNWYWHCKRKTKVKCTNSSNCSANINSSKIILEIST